jgi:hypothetical protein
MEYATSASNGIAGSLFDVAAPGYNEIEHHRRSRIAKSRSHKTHAGTSIEGLGGLPETVEAFVERETGMMQLQRYSEEKFV